MHTRELSCLRCWLVGLHVTVLKNAYTGTRYHVSNRHHGLASVLAVGRCLQAKPNSRTRSTMPSHGNQETEHSPSTACVSDSCNMSISVIYSAPYDAKQTTARTSPPSAHPMVTSCRPMSSTRISRLPAAGPSPGGPRRADRRRTRRNRRHHPAAYQPTEYAGCRCWAGNTAAAV